MNNPSDHDLIVALGVQMQNVRDDIKELKDSTSTRVALLEKDNNPYKGRPCMMRKCVIIFN